MATRSLSRSAGNGPSMWLWLGIALAVVLLDQFAKALIEKRRTPKNRV